MLDIKGLEHFELTLNKKRTYDCTVKTVRHLHIHIYWMHHRSKWFSTRNDFCKDRSNQHNTIALWSSLFLDIRKVWLFEHLERKTTYLNISHQCSMLPQVSYSTGTGKLKVEEEQIICTLSCKLKMFFHILLFHLKFWSMSWYINIIRFGMCLMWPKTITPKCKIRMKGAKNGPRTLEASFFVESTKGNFFDICFKVF